jgi:hypothetical protein
MATVPPSRTCEQGQAYNDQADPVGRKGRTIREGNVAYTGSRKSRVAC